jgi:hypothetical protein
MLILVSLTDGSSIKASGLSVRFRGLAIIGWTTELGAFRSLLVSTFQRRRPSIAIRERIPFELVTAR